MTFAPEHADIDQDAAHMHRKRRGIREALKAELGMLVLVCGVLTAMSLGLEVAAGGVAGLVAAVLAFAPIPLLVAAGLWLDRYEPEPVWLLVRTFAWGAAVAIFFAGAINSSVASGFGDAAATVGSAPIAEEFLKGLAVLWIFRRRREQFNGVLDGVTYALFVGLGFSVVENVDYYLAALQSEGVGALVVTWVIRGLATPFLHPFFTMFTGIGIGLASRPGRGALARVVLIVGGYLVAVTLHAVWNSDIGLLLYPVFYLPAFVVTFVVIRRSLRRQAVMLRTHLEPEVASGLLRREDLESIVQPSRGLRALGEMRRRDDAADLARDVRSYAWLLASHRARVLAEAGAGTATTTGDLAREAELRSRLWRLRGAASGAPPPLMRA